MELEKDVRVILSNDEGGQMVCRVDAVTPAGALLVPVSNDLKKWYPKGYHLGRAHWDAWLEVVPTHV